MFAAAILAASLVSLIYRRIRRVSGRPRPAEKSRQAQPGPRPAAELPSSPTGPQPSAGRGRILLVDDVPINRVVGKGLLESLGYEVETAASGAVAVERVREGTYTSVFMDCQMPEVDGYETTRLIRALEGDAAKVPIIALTAAVMTGDRDRCLEAGMDDYISKPLNLESLRRVLDRRLKGDDRPAATENGRPPGGSETELVDKLAEFKLRFSPSAYERICREFLSSTPAVIAELDSAVRLNQVDAAVSLAHKLKGSMSTFGALRLSELARLLEGAQKQGRPGLELLDEISMEYSKARAIVESELPQ